MVSMDTYFLIYDDHCPVCQTSVKQVKKLDDRQLIRLIPLSNPAVPVQLSLPSQEDLKKEIHLFAPDGSLYKGAEAIAEISSLYRKSSLLGFVMRLPVLKQISHLVYKLIANNRHRLK